MSSSVPTNTSPSSRIGRFESGDRVRVIPSHVDPTVAYHRHLHLVDDDDVLESWPVDLRGW